MDPRHEERIKIVQNLFASSFPDVDHNLPDENNPTVKEILKRLPELDEKIQAHAAKFPVNRIAKSDLAILRLAVYEMTVAPNEPAKVIINEAVDLAKELGSDRSFAFVNAVLGSILKEFEEKKPQ
jgi:transcription antitermination protein NusB